MSKIEKEVTKADVTKVASSFKIPSINFEVLAANQRKNVEAIATAIKVGLESLQEVAHRQGEIVTQGIEDFTGAVGDLISAGSFEDYSLKQVENAKGLYQKTVGNLLDLGEMVTKANSRTMGVFNKRIAEGLDEVKGIVGA